MRTRESRWRERPARWGIALLAVCGTVWSVPALAEPANPNLAKAKEQIADLYFEEALASLQLALERGTSSPQRSAEIYRLLGEVHATLDQIEPATSAFVAFLSIDPDGELADGQSPKITKPFEDARKQIAGKGIEIRHAVKSKAPPKLLLVVDNDPATIVAGARAEFWMGSGSPQTTRAKGAKQIDIELPDGATQLVLYAVDDYGNTLASIGSKDDPIVLVSGAAVVPDEPADEPEPDDKEGFRYWWVVSGVATVGLAAAGTVAGVSAQNKVDDLQAAIDNSENLDFGSDVKPIEDKARRHALYSNIAFGAAGVGAVVTAILFYTSLDEAEEKPPAAALGPMVSPETDSVGVSAAFRF